MPTAKTQLQVRVDVSSKNAVRTILGDYGLDLSTAVNMFLKYIERTETLPFDFRDRNGFRPHKAVELREALREVRRKRPKMYPSVDALIADILR
jgi:DNA-damage-inducible protein J